MINNNLIDSTNFTLQEVDELFNLAHQIVLNPSKFSQTCKGKILATLFYESSTRTRLSFESAMMRLGGTTLGFSDPNSSSVSKGESLADTIRTVSIYSDIIALRHPKEGAAKLSSMFSSVPLINAGDGGHQHPTQTLTDLFTIKSYKKNLSNNTIGICGDLKYGRTVHSLIEALSRYDGNKFVLISPEELKIPDYIREDILIKNNIEFKEVAKLEDVISELDVLYMTRIQEERFVSKEEYLRLKNSYILDTNKLNNAKKDMIIMHPLPRVNEIDIEVDSDSRAIYFKQAKYGMYVRMALIIKLLGLYASDLDPILNSKKEENFINYDKDLSCSNLNCITLKETYAPKLLKNIDNTNTHIRCVYCNARLEQEKNKR